METFSIRPLPLPASSQSTCPCIGQNNPLLDPPNHNRLLVEPPTLPR
ncbi:MAG: hypothetical protein RI897_1641 [Verrucomicrobiota bacterium]